MPKRNGPVLTLEERVITPESGLDSFRKALASIAANWPQAWSLGWRFYTRDTSAEHRQSLLGYLWLLVPPLANTLVWVFLNDQDVVRIDSGGAPHTLFILSGTVLWTVMNGSLMAVLTVVNTARGVLAKVNFPHEALIYSAILKSLTDAVVASALLIPALFLFRIPMRAEMLLFPVALIACLLLGAVLALAILPLAALYSDVSRAVQLVLRFGFFLTPVIFQLPALGQARTFMLANPVAPLIVSGRTWLLGTGETFPTGVAAIVAASILVGGMGLVLYKVAMPSLIERLSS